ncbi:MAG TPA: serine/threonine-protein kinase, partial [Kofleriaceae bacterium]|nr:serine/threonine-protein kinase [Kofleriaceae bacterium]
MGQCPTCGRRTTGFAFCPDDGAELLPDRDAAPAAGSALPRELDRYRLLRAIGQGGTSDVFEAEHLHTGKRVAIKLLRRELAGDPHAIERLRREARTASSIGHRNIVHVEDFGVAADGAVYLAMEWLEGETLDARIERGPLAQAAAIDLVLQIAAGLGAAHAAGVVHRDLKPANVFLVPLPGGGDQVKLLDFGIAKLVMSESRLTRTGTFLGTPDYVAPEQALGDEVDERADLYGLGVVLYQLVTGTLPFTGATFMAVLHRHTTQAPEAPSHRAPHRGISVELEAVILRCLAKRPVDRFASAEEVSRALEEVREATTPAPARTRTRARTGTLTPTPAPARSRAPSAPSAPPPAPARPRAPSAPSAPSAPPEPRGESPWPTPGPGDPDDGDSLEIPGRRRPARLWLPVLILAAGAAGAAGGVLALRGRRDDR